MYFKLLDCLLPPYQKLSPVRIVLAYMFVGIVWVMFSDTATAWLVNDLSQFKCGAIITGISFVVVTSGFLHLLIHFYARQLRSSCQPSLIAEKKIEKLEYYNDETGLPNINLLMDRLNQAIAVSSRRIDTTAVIFISLTGYKAVVDARGLNGGSEVVRAIGERLIATLRQYDTVARIHRDEFVVVLGGPVHEGDVSTILRKLQAVFDEPLMLGADEAIIPACFGVACFPADGATSELLIQNAHIAMNQARKNGLTYQYYSEELNQKAVERHTIETGMLRAIDEGEFFLCYQPKMAINGEDVVGMEALVRWQRPGQGVIPPDRFIPAAEESGLIIRLGAFVLREACRQNKAWQDAGLPKLKVAVNLSARQLLDNDLVPLVLRILEETGLEPCYLELELTESALMSNASDTVLNFLRLKELGIGLTVDDFGTGYSSLSYLKLLPVDTIKIDRSFVSDVVKDPDDAAIVDAIISMAHSLKLNVVAEGVETLEQLDFLRQRNCQQAQGFLFSKPLVPHQFEFFLRTGKTAVAKAGMFILEFSADFSSFEGSCNYQDQPDWNIALHGTIFGESGQDGAEKSYRTNLGTIKLVMQGDKVSGSFDHGNGHIDGLMQGRQVTGNWTINAETEYVAPNTFADKKCQTRRSAPYAFPEKVEMVRELANHPAAMSDTFAVSAEVIGDIAVKPDPVLPGDTIPMVLNRFQRDNHLLVLPVVENGRVVGVINRSTFLEEHVIGRHGFGIHINYSKKLRDLMLPVELAIEGTTPIEEVARIIQASRQNLTRLDNIFVLADGVYSGIVSVNKLFSAITEINLTLAKGANPLTGMPGNERIQREINKRLKHAEGFDIAYIDIDNFKPFNDNYGFQRGDVVIKTIGEIITNAACSSVEVSCCFCGHIGGDDFIIIAEPNRLEAVSTQVIKALGEHLPLFHGEKDYAAGCYSALNRKGEQETFGLLSLSIGIVNTRLTPVDSYVQLASISTEVKKRAKKQPGSSVVLNRRNIIDSKHLLSS
jgi:diguanylate cyclase (GGDEF)-like protein